MKISCKMRREGWKVASKSAIIPEEIREYDRLDIIFWDDVEYLNTTRHWCWGWDGDHPNGRLIRYWRFTPK